ncbi:UNVERIFIED_CONTAM: hypothetical protein FKN15_017490 [Acipenser sinensis]
MWPSKPFQPRRPQERQWRRAPPQQQAQSRGSMTAPSGVSARGQPAFDVEVPLHLLRYVCLFCGKHGLSLMKDCFESGTPETLPFPIAHAFITVVSNIRIWLHIPAVMQHIIPFRTYVIRYLCKLSDQELRQSAARNMADLMWSTVKEPLDTALCFDKESLDLAFKYFMSPTLTMRLAGLSQVTNQLHTFNDVCNNESLVSDTETSIAKELADWLINNNVVEHIFGPNLHIELKHCSRYIHDLFPSFIKNLDPVPLRHLLNLVSALHPSAHTEQTLYLASMLIKALWNNALTAKAQLSKQSSFASLLNTNLPMGNKKGSPAASPESSDNSDTHHSGGSDIEMDEQIMNRAKRVQQRLSDTEESMQGSSDETANSGEDASSGPGSSSGRSDGSSNEVNSSHASQSAGSPVSEVHSEDMADSEALKEEEEEEEEEDIEVERGRSPQKESRNPELRKRKLESHAIPICLGEPQGATDRSGANSGTGKDLPFNPEAVSSVDSRMRMLDASSHPEDPDHDMAEEISSTQLSQGSQDPCISRPGDFMGEAIGNELFNCRRFIGPQHHHHHPHHHHPHHHAHEGHIDDMLSADDVSCSSSQVSAKSEKNMADFDGEESGCEEELVQINSHAELTSHLQHLPNLASIYHEHLSQGPAVHKHQYTGNAITDINLDNVCKKGNTLLWDLVQDEDAIHLSEGLINEAEKLLCSLVCWFTDRQIRMRFIEGCLENLSNHRWAEKELHMMKLFFENLLHYIQEVREELHKFALYGHSAEVQVRLQFLTCVFSTLGSPDHFRLSLEQVDILWHCLVEDSECYDDALHWFLNQVRSKDQHAMGMETYKHLFLEKMPQLKPEIISMTGLNLFQHLCNLARLATSAYDSGSNCELCGMDQLWGIALRAQSADVSRAAIQYINSYYINGKTGLEKEQEFISKCMESLMMASGNLEKDPQSSLTIIERGLLMLKTHLEAFRRRFAYHLRQWQIDGKGISSHLKALSDKQSLPLRIVCQPAGLPDKMTIEMYPSDQVADLRAEVTHWYENLQKEQMNQQAQLQEFGQSSRQGDFPGGLMGPVRMISSGHELTTDYDEKTLHELGFKDMQMVFVSLGAPRRERKGEGVQLPASCLPPPQKDNIPMLLLLQEPHLTTLFDLLEMLASFKPPFGERSVEDTESARCEELHLNAENLSRRVWELLMLLPTCPNMLQAFQNISEEGSYSDLYPDSDDSSEDQIENSKNSWSCKVEDYEDEPVLRTGCKEYFWLLCKLIDNIHVKDASQTTLLDLDALARHLADCIRREILDQQDGNLEDDGLTGLLRLATSVVKHKPPFKFSQEGQDFLKDVFNLLFLLPSLKDRHQPKCKSHSARAAAYDLLVEMVKGSVENYRLLHNSVIAQHMQSSHAPYKWDYWPHDDVRAECRFVGLTNLGATCYLASTIQQLYMIPEARQAVFTAKKNTVKSLFGGVITNNVVSLDCEHVSQTAEEFYTVRCQVADMKNIYESLDEVTIKDTLEGDNMYTCSQCGKKVRAEKRACFKKLPRILSFNTMRYTFNMVTMMKEKVNTHFSFPLRLDMTSYTEDFLMGKCDRKDGMSLSV